MVADEVYEHLTFDAVHIPIATLPGMRERTVTLSSAGKTFSFTGWKVGWATGPADLIGDVRTTQAVPDLCQRWALSVRRRPRADTRDGVGQAAE